MNCMSENDDISRPMIESGEACWLAPAGRIFSAYSSAIRGNSGSTMPKPSRSMKTTRKTISRAERFETRGGPGGEAGIVASEFCIRASWLETKGAVDSLVDNLGISGLLGLCKNGDRTSYRLQHWEFNRLQRSCPRFCKRDKLPRPAISGQRS